MSSYKNYIGIDIGKFSFVVSENGSKSTVEYENTDAGIERFIKATKKNKLDSLCVVETTGGYELDIVYRLVEEGYKVHRADGRKVKNYIRSMGSQGKTDAMDAIALAKYGQERGETLKLFELQTEESIELYQLVQCRSVLKRRLVEEKNRLKSPSTRAVSGIIEASIKMFIEQMEEVTKRINQIISNNEELRKKREVLKTVPGIGDIVAFELLVLMPELGKLNRSKIGALGGVAPQCNDSGKRSGYRRTGHGRLGVKRILYMAGMAARKSNTRLREYYEELIGRGKKKMVALVALMRKILIIANARVREAFPQLAE